MMKNLIRLKCWLCALPLLCALLRKNLILKNPVWSWCYTEAAWLGWSLLTDSEFSFLICRFQTVAYLQQIWWFEVDGEVEFPFPPGNYSLYFRLLLGRATKKLGRRVCNTERVHGWDRKPVQCQLWTSDGQSASSQFFLTERGKWHLYRAGDFVVDNANASTKIKFSMTQIDCTHTKGGLCLDSVIIRPSEFRERLKHF